nr:SLAM family member 9-like [Misgurnus anguillicaudatus]
MAEDHNVHAFLIILLISITGFSTEDTVFVKTGASVQLNIQRDKLPDEFDEMTWENDKSENVVKYMLKEVRPHPSYKDRVDFNTESFSLTLKNMKKTDSGVYRAIAYGESKTLIAKHRVSVIDAVKTPELTVISYPSSDSCTVNFTCRAHNLTLHSTYNNDNCSPEEVTSHEKFTLILICSNESIICNHSNPISWKTDRIDIKQLCKGNESSAHRPSQSNTVFIVMLVVFVLLLQEYAVKTPELTVISDPSIDSCTVNFTCRAHDLTLYSTYNNDNCSPEEVTSHDNFTLILICSNESIICNHSNPISWKTDRIDIKQLCKGNEGPNLLSPSQTDSVFSIWMLVFVVGVIVFCCLVPYCCCRNKKISPVCDELVKAVTLAVVQLVMDLHSSPEPFG